MNIEQLGNNQNRFGIQRNTSVNKSGQEFQKKLGNIVGERGTKDEYVSAARNDRNYCESYDELKRFTPITGQHPMETQNDKIEAGYEGLKSDNIQRIEDEDFWNKFFEELDKKGRSDEKENSDEKSEDSSDSNIVVKPDGSRILLITTKTCGMESTMSIEISKPTDIQTSSGNETNEQMKNVTDLQDNVTD